MKSKPEPTPDNQFLCDVHYYLMPDGHCTCKKEKCNWNRRHKRLMKRSIHDAFKNDNPSRQRSKK
jgi:hypothetical protein